ncbi:MAG: GMP synthase [glutamine-hydrolyzing] [Chlamydiae bacterium]|nr:GMP synthase [glutamine-hydrolyzing] [Chlamydiota bacterium]
MEKILIIDFGSQYTQLIARRLRELKVFTKIVDPHHPYPIDPTIKGIILSGGPGSTEETLHPLDPNVLNGKTPVLGICYGMQLINVLNKGRVESSPLKEYGKQRISIEKSNPIFKGLNEEEVVWMSHGDSISDLAPNYRVTARSHDGVVAAIQHQQFPHFGVQFHPEVTHTPNGHQILDNFLSLCCCSRDWTPHQVLENIKKEIRDKVQNGRVISLVSGGVDSTVATFLCYEALGPEKVIPIHVDSGLMRHNESKQVVELLRSHGMKNLDFIDASEEFLNSLTGISEPEKKRQIIGDLFIQILDREMAKLKVQDEKTYLCQGTLYTDLIESGKGCGKKAAVIKSHHNVNSPFVDEKRQKGLIIEPNAQIFKDEVRSVGEAMGIPHHLVWRHPFPGPGLAIRIMGEVTKDRLETLRAADEIYIDEIRKAGLYDHIWQAFAVLLPISTVGVMGDQRTEGHVIALRAVSSADGMTADFSNLPHEILGRVSTRIINEVPRINRVVLDVTSKPPGTIEWE